MKKGFTLIELLATMVILGFISIITIPLMMDILKHVEENNYRNSVYGLLRAVESAHTEGGATTSEYIIRNGVVEPSVDFTGKIDGSGSIIYDENEKTTVKIGNDKMCATKEPNKKQIIVTAGKCQ